VKPIYDLLIDKYKSALSIFPFTLDLALSIGLTPSTSI
jgi:hypothetical protein